MEKFNAKFMFALVCSNEVKAASVCILAIGIMTTLTSSVVTSAGTEPLWVVTGAAAVAVGTLGLATSCFFKQGFNSSIDDFELASNLSKTA